MDFIESLFGLSPDGGDGTLEFLWVVALGVAVAAWLGRKQLRSWWLGRER